MKAKVIFSLEIEIEIETEKDRRDTSVHELDLKKSNLGNSLFDTLKNMSTNQLLNDITNTDYQVQITSVSCIKDTKLLL